MRGGQRKHERVDEELIAKVQKLRKQGLTYAVIGERLGLGARCIEKIALKATEK